MCNVIKYFVDIYRQEMVPCTNDSYDEKKFQYFEDILKIYTPKNVSNEDRDF